MIKRKNRIKQPITLFMFLFYHRKRKLVDFGISLIVLKCIKEKMLDIYSHELPTCYFAVFHYFVNYLVMN